MYGLDSITLTTKDLNRIDGFWFRFLRRIVGIKASFYCKITNEEMCRKANTPEKRSTTRLYTHYKTTIPIFKEPPCRPNALSSLRKLV